MLTLAVPMLNEAATIVECLRSVANQTHKPDEVLLVDGGSRDGTQEIALDAARRLGLNARLLTNPGRTVPKGLNIALQSAQGDYFFKLSAHATVSERYFEVLAGRLAEGFEGVGGKKEAVGATVQGMANARALNSRLGVGGSVYHYAQSVQEVAHVPSGGYQTATLRELGGWDEDLPVNQDVELDIRLQSAGGRLLLDPGAVSYWHCRQTLTGLFLQYRRYGCGKAHVTRRHFSRTLPRHLAPSVLVLGTLAGAALGVTGPRRALGIVPVGTYLAALSLGAIWENRGIRRDSARFLLALCAMHFSYGIGFLEGLVGRQPAASQMSSRDSSSPTRPRGPHAP